MNRNTAEAEDRLLLSKAYDAIELSEKWGKPQFLPFLNEHESLYLKDHISYKENILFFGGYDDAVRVMMGAGAVKDDFPITPLEVTFREEFSLKHKDFLGSLMGLGLERSAVGDILTEEGRAVIFVRSDIAPFILSQLDKIGRVGVKVQICDTDHLPVSDDFELFVTTLSSLRLDAFVSAVTHLSREKSSTLIRTDMVTVDHVTENSVSCTLKEGNTVTIRKYGKYVFTKDLGVSKKGKAKIEVKHFR